MKQNKGLSYCLNKGLLLCNNEIVFRMDSDDIMLPQRINVQLEFMNQHPDCVLCGTNVIFFQKDDYGLNKKIFGHQTAHKECLNWTEYRHSKPRSLWILNHPTLCFKKSAILNIGNYNRENNQFFEDLELELKILKKYGQIYNIPQVLLEYRIHKEQITFGGKANTNDFMQKKNQFIDDLCNAD